MRGTNQIQRVVIARNLLKGARDHSHLDEYIPTEVQETYEPEAEAATT